MPDRSIDRASHFRSRGLGFWLVGSGPTHTDLSERRCASCDHTSRGVLASNFPEWDKYSTQKKINSICFSYI